MHATTPARQPAIPPRRDERAGKYLTFKLGEEEFGVSVLNVREIMAVQRITAVPRTTDYLKGVFNLRGKLVAAMDLRLKLGLAEVEYTPRTCIIVVEVAGEAGDIQVGLVVDAVSEVVNVTASDIEDMPGRGAESALPFILGVARAGSEMKILLDIGRVAGAPEMAR